jgi:hypothetical protein
VRPLEEELGQRLGHEHLPAPRDDDAFELRQERRAQPVGGDDDLACAQLVERVAGDGGALDDLRPGRGSACCEPPHPAGGMDRGVARVQDGAAEEPAERGRQRLDLFDREAVGTQRLELVPERVRLMLPLREPEAADAPARIACERLQAVECALAQPPEQACPFATERSLRPVVRHRTAAQGKAAVAAARARGDLARLEQADAQPTLGERQRARAARHAAADDDHVDLRRDRRSPSSKRLSRLGEPV